MNASAAVHSTHSLLSYFSILTIIVMYCTVLIFTALSISILSWKLGLTNWCYVCWVRGLSISSWFTVILCRNIHIFLGNYSWRFLEMHYQLLVLWFLATVKIAIARKMSYMLKGMYIFFPVHIFVRLLVLHDNLCIYGNKRGKVQLRFSKTWQSIQICAWISQRHDPVCFTLFVKKKLSLSQIFVLWYIELHDE